MKKSTLAGLIIIILHMVGVAGMLVPGYNSLMRSLTPLNLLLVAVLVIYFQADRSGRFMLFSIVCFVAGFTIEWVGIRTGWPFGSYYYGNTLGPKLGGVPLVIGLNWLVLTLSTASLLRRIRHLLAGALAGAVFMVCIDYLIEPVAISNDYWHWESPNIPIENYIAWGFVAFLLHLLLRAMSINLENKIDIFVVGSQVLFFATLNFF